MRSKTDDVRAAIEAALATDDYALVSRFVDDLHADQLADIYSRIQHGCPVGHLDEQTTQAVYARTQALCEGAALGDSRGDIAVAVAMALRAQPKLSEIAPSLPAHLTDDASREVRYEILYDSTGYGDRHQGYHQLFGSDNIGNRTHCNLRQAHRVLAPFFVTKWSAQYMRIHDYNFRNHWSRADQEKPLLQPFGTVDLEAGAESFTVPVQRLLQSPVPVMRTIEPNHHFAVNADLRDSHFDDDHARFYVYLEGFSFRELP
jgi:hypothetical protein